MISEPTAFPVAVPEPTQGRLQVTFVPANVWRTGMVVLVLHALWDFGTLGQTTTGRSQKPLAGVLVLATFALGLVATGFIVAAS